jgi:hypothetical protein
VGLGLDPFGQHHGTCSSGVSPDRRGRHTGRRGRPLDDADVQLGDVGLEQRNQSQRVRVGPQVVDGHQVAPEMDAVGVTQQVGRPSGQRALGELHHDLEGQVTQQLRQLIAR